MRVETQPNGSTAEFAPLTIQRILADDTARDDPHGVFAQTRDISPIYQTEPGIWVVTGHAAAMALSREKRLSRWESARTELFADDSEDAELRSLFARDPELKAAIDAVNHMLILRDEPDHTRLRNLVRHAFLPAAIEEWRARVEAVAADVLDKVEGKREFDFLKEVAFPLPEIVICEMTGVPHSDLARWSVWSKACVGASRTPKPRGAQLRRAQEGYRSFYVYFKDLIAHRRGTRGNDLISLLLRAEEEGDKLSEDEIIATMTMLIQAGHETTANLIGNGMLILLDNREIYARLVKNPGEVPQAVDEFLRVDGPTIFGPPRVAMEDITCEGITIPKGHRIIFIRAAINRDPTVFPDPDTVDIDRTNLHLFNAFGSDIHTCLGRHLALLESRIMFREIVRRLPNLELVERPRYTPMHSRGLQSLKVRRRDAN